MSGATDTAHSGAAHDGPPSEHAFQTYFPESGGVDMEETASWIDDTTIAEMRELAARYPQPRSALLPMLHLVQSVDGRISPRGIEVCAEVLGITTAQVTGVATFYTMYKRRPGGQHLLGVCTTALCGVMGGDYLLAQIQDRLGIHEGETTEDGRITLERLECNAACDFAPVLMVNWEFFDDMTPAKVNQLIDDLEADREVTSPRGAVLTTWREAERVLAGFPDGRADEGPAAGPASLLGLEIAQEQGWKPAKGGKPAKAPAKAPAAKAPAAKASKSKESK